MADPDAYLSIYVTHVFETSRCTRNPKYSNILFWGRNNREAGVAIDEQIAGVCEDIEESPVPVLYDLRKAKMLLASVSGEWVRARVKELSVDSQGQIEVSCIDHGFTVNLGLHKLRLLPKQLESLQNHAPLASKYCLADIVMHDDPELKEKVEDYLKETIHHKVVKAVMLGSHQELCGARVYHNDQLIAKALHDMKLAQPSDTYDEAIKMPVPTIELPHMPNAVLDKHNYLSAKGSSAPIGIARPLVNNLSPPVEEKAPSPVKPARSQSSYCAAYLEPDVVHHVTVTHVQKGPWRFTVRRKCAETDFGLAGIQERIVSLETHMQLKPLASPQIGTPCIVRSTSDGSLHRGLISSAEDVQTFNVYFVDQGRFELASMSKLYQIPKELIAVELMAIRVSLSEADELANFTGVGEKFAKMALNRSFHCRVVDLSLQGPQEVRMFDDSGRNVKDILVASFIQPHLIVNATTPSIFLSVPEKQSFLQASRPGLMRMDLKIEPPEVDATEKLFVTYVGRSGQFFGQFEKRTMEDLKAITDELKTVYGKQSSDLPLLYSDVRSHIGDFAVVRHDDGVFYRAKVIKEFVNDVEVFFVDYGDVTRVYRHEILAPVKALKLFTHQPFGINCIVAGVTATAEDWQALLIDKSVPVKIGPGVESVYSVTFIDETLNVDLQNANNAGKQSTETPTALTTHSSCPHDLMKEINGDAHVPSTSAPANERPWPMHTNGKLVLDFSDEKDGKQASSGRSTSSVNDFILPPQMASYRNPSYGNRNSLESFELKRSPRPLPIAEPPPLFFSEAVNVEGKTKQVEVVHVDGTDSFYCHVLEDVPQLEEMVLRLNAAYSEESKPSLHFGKIEQACVAKYEDGAWYRGKIIEVNGSEANILFVDYGNQQRGPLGSLKAIDEEFTKLPPQAYHCTLRMVPHCDEKAKFEEAVTGKTLQASFYRIGSDKKYETKLFCEENGVRAVINEQFGAPATDSVPAPSTDFTPLSFDTVALEVSIAWFYNVNRFFLSPSDLSPYQHYLDDLDQFYSSLAFGELVEEEPKVGMACVVRFVEDQKYYRAKILSIQNQTAEVLFVDYGNEQDTPVKELKRITPRFMTFPQLTWECKLKDVKLVPASADTIPHISACFMTGETVSALIHPVASDGVHPTELTVGDIDDVHEYLIRHKVIERVQQKTEWSIAPQSFDFAPGQMIFTEAVVPFVRSTTEFWVQPDHKKTEELMERLDALAAKPEFVCKRSFAPAVGKNCLAWYTDERWYRAVIEKLEGDTASVHYVDYGNSFAVSTHHLRALPAEYASEPAMAYRCRLYGAENLPQEMNDKFAEVVVEDYVRVLFVESASNVLQVRLFTKDGADVGETIGLYSRQTREVEAYISYAKSASQFWIQLKSDDERLASVEAKLQEWCNLNAGPARPDVGGVYGVHHPVYETWYRARVRSISGQSAEAHFIDYGDTHTVSIAPDNITKLPDFLLEIPPLAVECRLKSDRSDFGQLSESGSVLRLVLTGKQGDAEVVESISVQAQDVLGALEKPETNHEEVAVQRAAADEANYSPGQVLSAKAQAFVIYSAWDVWIQSDPAAASDFTDQVTQYTNSEAFARAPDAKPAVGGHFLARFPDDNLWYRAEVTAIEKDRVNVVYFDYGDSCVVDAKMLKPLPPSLIECPPFARRFALDGVESPNLPLPDAAQCQNALFGKELTVTFVKKAGKHLFVRLYDKDGADLNQQLGLDKLVDQSLVAQNASHMLLASIPEKAVEVIVSHAESNNCFWVQRKSDENMIREIETALCATEKEMLQRPPPSVVEGDMYVISHPIKQRLFRGRADKITEDWVSVYLVDVGETVKVPKADLRSCPEIFKLMPNMAIECSFRRPVYPDQYFDELLRAFKEATEGFVCYAVFDGLVVGHGIHMLETLYANGIDVLTMLSGRLVSSTPQSGKALTGNNFPLFSNGNHRGL